MDYEPQSRGTCDVTVPHYTPLIHHCLQHYPLHTTHYLTHQLLIYNSLDKNLAPCCSFTTIMPRFTITPQARNVGSFKSLSLYKSLVTTNVLCFNISSKEQNFIISFKPHVWGPMSGGLCKLIPRLLLSVLLYHATWHPDTLNLLVLFTFLATKCYAREVR